MHTNNQFATVRELSKIFPSFSEPSLRYLIFNAQKNGINKCIRKIGRKIIFNVPAFETWINSQGGEYV
jgi:hypothetical protein